MRREPHRAVYTQTISVVCLVLTRTHARTHSHSCTAVYSCTVQTLPSCTMVAKSCQCHYSTLICQYFSIWHTEVWLLKYGSSGLRPQASLRHCVLTSYSHRTLSVTRVSSCIPACAVCRVSTCPAPVSLIGAVSVCERHEDCVPSGHARSVTLSQRFTNTMHLVYW